MQEHWQKAKGFYKMTIEQLANGKSTNQSGTPVPALKVSPDLYE